MGAFILFSSLIHHEGMEEHPGPPHCLGVEVSRLHPTSQEPGRVFSASQASCNELISKRDFQGKLTADDYGKMFSKGENNLR